MAKAIRGMNQLLALGQSDAAAVDMHSFDIIDLIKTIVLEFLPFARSKHIDLGIDIESEQLNVLGDKNLIQHAISNIIHNAVCHCTFDGTVTIKAIVTDGNICVSVIDDGPGIPDFIVNRLGERFIKGNNKNGSGLGLAIANSVIKKHYGLIEVINLKSPQGTEVKLTWPNI